MRTGFITEFDVAECDRQALQFCFHRGWLHADKLPDANCSKWDVGYFFTTPLHLWFVQWKLGFCRPPLPLSLNVDDLQTFAFKVISLFSPILLASEQRFGPGCIQRPLEAQYHDEFYRCCHVLSNGSIVSFPEFGCAKGRVDFYIPAKQWGVELLREGNRLADHCGRFSSSGSYATMLALSDHIILDCRTSCPRDPHPSMCIHSLSLCSVTTKNNFCIIQTS
jgi:hypothetical protein